MPTVGYRSGCFPGWVAAGHFQLPIPDRAKPLVELADTTPDDAFMTADDKNPETELDRSMSASGCTSALLTSDEDFRAALRDLVRDAVENGIDVEGEWSTNVEFDDEAWDVDVSFASESVRSRVYTAQEAITTIVQVVAERENTDPTDLPPLHDTIDMLIFESLLQSVGDEAQQHVRFLYCGHQITVYDDGTVLVSE